MTVWRNDGLLDCGAILNLTFLWLLRLWGFRFLPGFGRSIFSYNEIIVYLAKFWQDLSCPPVNLVLLFIVAWLKVVSSALYADENINGYFWCPCTDVCVWSHWHVCYSWFFLNLAVIFPFDSWLIFFIILSCFFLMNFLIACFSYLSLPWV